MLPRTGRAECGAPRRYEGRDWRSQASWGCEKDKDLFSSMDSSFAALQEAMFIPGKEGVLHTSDELLNVASAYERWMEQQASTTLYSSAHLLAAQALR